MIVSESLKKYQCAFNDEKHFLIEPIELDCGHFICKKCGKLKSNGIIRCIKCDKKNRIDLNNLNDRNEMRYHVKSNISQLFETLEKQYTKTLADLNNCVNKILDQTESEVENARFHIDHRVEAMKNQLDNLANELKKELQEHQDGIKNELAKINIKEASNELEEMKEYLKSETQKTETKLGDYQTKMLNLQTLIKDLSNFSQEISFESSKESLKVAKIGIIKSSNNSVKVINNINLANRIREGRYKIIYLNIEPFDLCVLPNGNFLCANYRDHNIKLYDKNLKMLKKVDQIDNEKFSPTGISTNKEDKIFICDYTNDRIFVTDFELNHIIQTIDSDQYKSNNFCDPNGICYYNGYLYVCDSFNKKIQKLTSNLVYKASYKFDYSPKQIRIANYLACVRPLDACSIYFYEIDTFKLRYRYDGHCGSISEINSYFYEYYEKTRKLYAYDENGLLIDEIQTKGFNNKIDIHDMVSLTYLNGDVLISSKDCKKLISINNLKCSLDSA